MWVTNPTEELWTGTEDNLRIAQTLADKINALDPQAFLGAEEPQAPSLLEKQGDVGVVRVHGQLFANVPAFIKAMFGLSDYNDIAQALVDAAKDPSISAIMLDVDSPGGAVSGIDSVANLVKRIDREVKPVVAHTDGTMASAAYWLSVGARRVTAGDLAHVGSIGVLQVHREASKAEAQDGITTTVLRAGRYKALGNPYEPLSDQARAEIQTKLDYTYGRFMGHVADSRGLPYDTANAKMGEGRVFIGELAQGAGLIDAVATFDEALTSAQQLGAKSVDSRKSLIQNPKKQEGANPMRKKAQLTEADIAALASGASPDEVAGTLAPQAAESSAEPVAEAAASEPTEPMVEAAAGAPVVAAPAVDQTGVISMLERQLAQANESLLAARVEHSKASDRVAELEALQAPLAAIARDSVSKMYIALGSDGAHVASLDTGALLAEHAKVSFTFKNRFKVGGVAAASAQADDTGKGAEPKPALKARLQAARIATK